ncbi:hypothetical protein Lupro_02815 [Lutibacter profundi]|uniref:Uncharacterized protein n=1 Tax=Lutibacter profundi TaxID=1622118 RepID=A0A0X8G569_9FLAO|nr:hypothetical protein [Lutibacter profundi]AMC10248.1 hypothetical protein Lupro_02815 [Lutibacter profundi]
MNNRIIKDIRYFETKPDNYHGKFDGIIGNIYQNSPDTNYIGQRIARKLNEFGFISGEFDHIYINLSPKLNDNEIKESSVFLDKQIRYFDYGFTINVFNNLTEHEKDTKIKEITFKVLNWIYKKDNLKTQLISDVQNLMDKYNKSLTINYKTKETNHYRIDLNFQIRPDNATSKLIIEFTDKKENKTQYAISDILDYEDLYSLIDKVTLKDGFVVFQPKKSYHAELVAGKYKKPLLSIDIKSMTENK